MTAVAAIMLVAVVTYFGFSFIEFLLDDAAERRRYKRELQLRSLPPPPRKPNARAVHLGQRIGALLHRVIP